MVQWIRASQASGIVMHSYGMLKCDGCLTTTWCTLALNIMIDIVNAPEEINFFLLSDRNCFPKGKTLIISFHLQKWPASLLSLLLQAELYVMWRLLDISPEGKISS
jgi:hypothetical protein